MRATVALALVFVAAALLWALFFWPKKGVLLSLLHALS